MSSDTYAQFAKELPDRTGELGVLEAAVNSGFQASELSSLVNQVDGVYHALNSLCFKSKVLPVKTEILMSSLLEIPEVFCPVCMSRINFQGMRFETWVKKFAQVLALVEAAGDVKKLSDMRNLHELSKLLVTFTDFPTLHAWTTSLVPDAKSSITYVRENLLEELHADVLKVAFLPSPYFTLDRMASVSESYAKWAAGEIQKLLGVPGWVVVDLPRHVGAGSFLFYLVREIYGIGGDLLVAPASLTPALESAAREVVFLDEPLPAAAAEALALLYDRGSEGPYQSLQATVDASVSL